MAAGGDAGETDSTGETVGNEGNPAMLSVTMREDRGDGHGGNGVSRIESAGMQWIVGAAEETVGVGAVAGIRNRLAAGGNGFHGEVQEEAVGKRFCGEERGIFGVRIFAEVADGVYGSGNGGDYGSRVSAAKRVVEVMEVGGGAEGRCGMGVGRDESRGDADDADSGKDELAMRERGGEEPDGFLVV